MRGVCAYILSPKYWVLQGWASFLTLCSASQCTVPGKKFSSRASQASQGSNESASTTCIAHLASRNGFANRIIRGTFMAHYLALYHVTYPEACPPTVGRSPPLLNQPLPPRNLPNSCHRHNYYHPPPNRNHTPLSNNNRRSLTTHGRYSARLLAVTMFTHPRRDRLFSDLVIPFP